MCLQDVDLWGRDLCDESKGFSEAVSHRVENDLTLKDMVESTVIA